MLYGFFGRVSAVNQLKDGLDASSQRTRMIADRVSKASLQGADGFAIPAMRAEPGTAMEGPVDLESEMVSLADEQLRFETTARLLQKAYQQIRSTLKG
jgi:hypothetical protein